MQPLQWYGMLLCALIVRLLYCIKFYCNTFFPILQQQIVMLIACCYNGGSFEISLIFCSFCVTVSLMKNSSHIPTGAISASVVNYCNLWSSYPIWYQFNSPVQDIIVLSKSRLNHVSCSILSKSQHKICKTFI